MPPRVRLYCPSCAFARGLVSSQKVPVKIPNRHYAAPVIHASRARRTMWAWLNGPGAVFRNPEPGSTHYLSAYDKQGRLIRANDRLREQRQEQRASSGQDANEEEEDAKAEGGQAKGNLPPETAEDLQPFPLNPFFRSEAVLSEALRHEIYKRVVEKRQSVREVAVALSVDMRRVAAVVRLQTVEQEWVKEGKKLAKPYAKAILGILPQTPYDPNARRLVRHENINDLPVHPATLDQVFHPTSESRRFTRVDAGRAFQRDLLPADERIPHPEMIASAKDRLNGVRAMEAGRLAKARIDAIEARRARKEEEQRKKEQARTTIVHSPRWEFVVKDVNIEAHAGKTGRGKSGVGARYGFPHEDRKKGQVKIPTKVG